jgi:hypothetical protein
VTVRRSVVITLVGCLLIVGLALVLRATASGWVSLPSSSGSERVANLLKQFPEATTETNYAIVVWSRRDGERLTASDTDAVATRITALAPLAPRPASVRANLAVNRRAILIELPLTDKPATASAPRDQPLAVIIRSRAGVALPSDLEAQVTGTVTGTVANTVTAIGSPPLRYPASSTRAQKTIDAAFGTGFGNRAIMLVPDSLAGETSTIAPTTLAMDFDTVHAVIREGSHAGRSELIVAINADPGSAKALATVRGIRKSLANTGGPTASTLVGGADAMEIDRASALGSARLVILLAAAFTLLLFVLIIFGTLRAKAVSANKICCSQPVAPRRT